MGAGARFPQVTLHIGQGVLGQLLQGAGPAARLEGSATAALRREALGPLAAPAWLDGGALLAAAGAAPGACTRAGSTRAPVFGPGNASLAARTRGRRSCAPLQDHAGAPVRPWAQQAAAPSVGGAAAVAPAQPGAAADEEMQGSPGGVDDDGAYGGVDQDDGAAGDDDFGVGGGWGEGGEGGLGSGDLGFGAEDGEGEGWAEGGEAVGGGGDVAGEDDGTSGLLASLSASLRGTQGGEEGVGGGSQALQGSQGGRAGRSAAWAGASFWRYRPAAAAAAAQGGRRTAATTATRRP